MSLVSAANKALDTVFKTILKTALGGVYESFSWNYISDLSDGYMTAIIDDAFVIRQEIKDTKNNNTQAFLVLRDLPEDKAVKELGIGVDVTYYISDNKSLIELLQALKLKA